MNFRNRSRGGNKQDGKYLRLTGLWPSKKKDTLWTGKIRNQDLCALIEKADLADQDGADMVVFLWENTEKDGPKSPDFTLQVSISEDQDSQSGRGGRSSRRSSFSRGDREKEVEENEEPEEEQNEEEEKPRRLATKAEPVRRSRSTGTSTSSKKDKNDW